MYLKGTQQFVPARPTDAGVELDPSDFQLQLVPNGLHPEAAAWADPYMGGSNSTVPGIMLTGSEEPGDYLIAVKYTSNPEVPEWFLQGMVAIR